MRVTVRVRNAGAVDAQEVVQCYVTPPSVANTTTPFFNLAAFAKPLLLAHAAPTDIAFVLEPDQLAVTLVDGSRTRPPGRFTFSLSGHLPVDRAGLAASNVVTATLDLA